MEEVTVHFATNRNPVPGKEVFGPGFRDGNDKSKYVTGTIRVTRESSLPDTGWVPHKDSLTLDPINEGAGNASLKKELAAPPRDDDIGIVRFARQQARFARVRRSAAPTYSLVLLPGFASTFMIAMSRAAQVAAVYKAAGIFCFSWPANGVVSPSDYLSDRQDATDSGLSIARSLARLLQANSTGHDVTRLSIVAHSMGNHALRSAIQNIRRVNAPLLDQRIFDTAELMAADEDFDALELPAKLGPLVPMTRQINVYTNGGDYALGAAQAILHIARLGHYGPRRLADVQNAVWIDCSDVGRTTGDRGETHWGHQYYRLSRPVINDVLQVLAGKKPAAVRPRLKNLASPATGQAFIIPFDPRAAGTPRIG